MIQLTKADTPSRPITINPAFIISLVPIRKVLPSMNDQNAGATTMAFGGTKIAFSDGTWVNVLENYDQVSTLLSPPQWEETSSVPSESWVPDNGELEAVRADMQKAVAVDAKTLLGKEWGVDPDGVPTAEKNGDKLTEAQVPGMVYGEESVDANLTVEIPDPPMTQDELFAKGAEAKAEREAEEQLSAAEKRKRTMEAKKKAADE